MVAQALWHGTEQELNDIVIAVQHNCSCITDSTTGARSGPCVAHAMLANDQRAINGLVFMRRQAQRLREQELDVRCLLKE